MKRGEVVRSSGRCSGCRCCFNEVDPRRRSRPGLHRQDRSGHPASTKSPPRRQSRPSSSMTARFLARLQRSRPRRGEVVLFADYLVGEYGELQRSRPRRDEVLVRESGCAPGSPCFNEVAPEEAKSSEVIGWPSMRCRLQRGRRRRGEVVDRNVRHLERKAQASTKSPREEAKSFTWPPLGRASCRSFNEVAPRRRSRLSVTTRSPGQRVLQRSRPRGGEVVARPGAVRPGGHQASTKSPPRGQSRPLAGTSSTASPCFNEVVPEGAKSSWRRSSVAERSSRFNEVAPEGAKSSGAR